MSVELGALIVLALTNLGTLGAFVYYIYLENKEKQKTINALIAKNSQEFLNHEFSDKTEKVKVEPQPDLRADLTELKDLTDEQFDENVLSKQ